jgi:hypothetical protein
LSSLGLTVETTSLGSASEESYDWCFLVNLYEISVAHGSREATVRQVAGLRQTCRRVALVLLESVQTPWFAHSLELCRAAGVELILDLGLHDQQRELPPLGRIEYQFCFNGLTRAERLQLDAVQPAFAERPIPWVFVGHLVPDRVKLARRLQQELEPNGFLYLPQLTPVTENGPHLNGQQFETVLRRARRQIWCSHHDYFYLEGERFRLSLLTGSLPIKVTPGDSGTNRPLPFRNLVIDEAALVSEVRKLDSEETWWRFAEEFRAAPLLDQTLTTTVLAGVTGSSLSWGDPGGP